MMDGTLPIYTSRPWIDHTQGASMGPIWTAPDKYYTGVNIVLGILFGFALPSVQRLIAHLIAVVCYWSDSGSDLDAEQQPLLNNSPSQVHKHRTRLNCSSLLPSKKNITKYLSVLFIFITICWAVAGTFVAQFAAGDAALSGSKRCGAWGLREDARAAAQDADALLQGEKEMRAGLYARDCYGPRSTMSINQCLVFKESYIDTSIIEREQQCPFVNDTYCPGTGFTAVKFSTGLVDAQRIGINVAKAPKFNRTTVCVPLDLKAGFAEKTGQGIGKYGYNLGPVNSEEYRSNYTFEQYYDPFENDVRSYTMSTITHMYAKAGSQNYWQPLQALDIRPELKSKSNPYSLTLMFINSCRILYQDSSDDPIFPAGKLFRDTGLWYNYDSRARPLACIDWIEVCTNEGSCAPPYQSDHDNDKHYEFTRFALNKSTAFHAIEFRGAMGLDAQYKIKDDISLPLAENPPQWVVESWGMFNTSLSRIQYDALDIANGTDGDKGPLYVPKMSSRFRDNMCGMFIFQNPKGYSNIRIVTQILFSLIPLLLWLLGHETGEEFGEAKKKSGWFGDGKLIGIEWLFCKILVFVKFLNTGGRNRGRKPSPQDASIQGVNAQSQGGSRPGSTPSYGTTSAPDGPRPSSHQPELPASNAPLTRPQQPELPGADITQTNPRPVEQSLSNQPGTDQMASVEQSTTARP